MWLKLHNFEKDFNSRSNMKCKKSFSLNLFKVSVNNQSICHVVIFQCFMEKERKKGEKERKDAKNTAGVDGNLKTNGKSVKIINIY